MAEQLRERGLLREDWAALEPVELGERLRTLVECVRYDGRTAMLAIVLRGGEGTGAESPPATITCPVPIACRRVPRPPGQAGRLPRVSRWMALVLHFNGLLREGTIRDQSELARLGRVSAARVSQLMNLLHLAPDSRNSFSFCRPFREAAIRGRILDPESVAVHGDRCGPAAGHQDGRPFQLASLVIPLASGAPRATFRQSTP